MHKARNLVLQDTGKPLKEVFLVFVNLENPFPFNSPDDNVVKGAWGVYGGLVRHGCQIWDSYLFVNKEITSLLPSIP